ncbi:MAG TPA: trypsin-like peptidase domain-containing protein [Rhodothermales bacterium]|nr:trypsin-like peptidase domain-containing protein [Rhodothermales bacterium]
MRSQMKRAACFAAFILVLAGCNHNARSQQQEMDRPPQRVQTPQTAPELGQNIQAVRQTAITRAVEAAAPAVVSVNVIEVQRIAYRDPFFDPWFEQFFGRDQGRVMERQVQGLGSGFVISPDGYVVTNDHVAGHATKITVSFPDGKTMDARLVGTDPASDVALLKVDTKEALPYLTFADSGDPLVGEWVIALGNPFGLFEAAEPTVTVGVVSATGRKLQGAQDGRIYNDMIQTDAAINHGNSGGPLVDALGEVIGMNTAIYSESGGSVGIGFAVPASKVKRIVEELRKNGSVDRDYYTGLSVMDVSNRIAQALQMQNAQGAFVRDIDSGSPAENAGILPYDVIVDIQGKPIANSNDYVARIYDFRPGDVVSVRVIRDGQPRTFNMKIGRYPG